MRRRRDLAIWKTAMSNRSSSLRRRTFASATLGLAASVVGMPWREADAHPSGSAGPLRTAASARPDHVMLGVDDMEAMIAWYRDKLGYRVEKAWTVDGLPGIRLAYLIGHGGYRMELIAGGRGPRTPDPASFDQHFRMRGYQHACYWVDDVDAVMEELQGRGVAAFFPATDFPKGAERRVAFVKDPEGT
jgi:catechol 2,3-dioxygenase-like lactoylglutathione lyase family enzyme